MKIDNSINFCSCCGHSIKYYVKDISIKGYVMRTFGIIFNVIFSHTLSLKVLNYIKKKKNLYNKSD